MKSCVSRSYHSKMQNDNHVHVQHVPSEGGGGGGGGGFVKTLPQTALIVCVFVLYSYNTPAIHMHREKEALEGRSSLI